MVLQIELTPTERTDYVHDFWTCVTIFPQTHPKVWGRICWISGPGSLYFRTFPKSKTHSKTHHVFMYSPLWKRAFLRDHYFRESLFHSFSIVVIGIFLPWPKTLTVTRWLRWRWTSRRWRWRSDGNFGRNYRKLTRFWPPTTSCQPVSSSLHPCLVLRRLSAIITRWSIWCRSWMNFWRIRIGVCNTWKIFHSVFSGHHTLFPFFQTLEKF